MIIQVLEGYEYTYKYNNLYKCVSVYKNENRIVTLYDVPLDTTVFWDNHKHWGAIKLSNKYIYKITDLDEEVYYVTSLLPIPPLFNKIEKVENYSGIVTDYYKQGL